MKISFELELNYYEKPTLWCIEEVSGIRGCGSSVEAAYHDLLEQLAEHPLSWRKPEDEEEERLRDYLVKNNCFIRW